ncbi:MAG: ATP-binding cassette domain-containing protein [Actinobacteria bacterium]|nr:ATP-binding cassette domain-containing protein [Actinomycetota bacterium]
MIDSGAASLARAATSAISDTSAGLSPAEPVVRVRGLVKRFGDRTAVAGVDLDVHRGEIFGLLGPNGAGKTTTMRAIYGVTIPSDGRVEVFGLDVAAHGRRVRARLGVTLQDNVLIEALSPVENLRVFCRCSGRRTTFHCADGAGLADLLRRQDGRHRHDLVVRPSNLEDLFLHLTGSDLEGGA